MAHLAKPEHGPSFAREQTASARGLAPVAGVDEVGRGPLAGPVVACAVILDPQAVPLGLADSKRLTAARREALYAEILDSALAVSIASLGPPAIDAINIRNASLKAMARALDGLALAPRFALVDGRDLPSLPAGCKGLAVIGGDASVASIAAASIVAKVHRDRLMAAVDQAAPGYGFGAHKGYGTAMHRQAIAALGASPHHRRSFRLMADTDA